MKLQNENLRSLLAAEYVMGTLRGRARSRFEYYVAQDKALAGRVDLWTNEFARLDASLSPVKPPRRVWKNIAARLGITRKRRWWDSVGLWRSTAVIAASITVAVLSYVVITPPPVVEPEYVAVINNQQAQAAWLVKADVQTHTLRVQVLAPQKLAADKAFELWLLPAEKKSPISMGLMPASGSLRLPLDPSLVSMLSSAAGVAVSLEPDGGSPTGQPTGPILYQGAIQLL